MEVSSFPTWLPVCLSLFLSLFWYYHHGYHCVLKSAGAGDPILGSHLKSPPHAVECMEQGAFSICFMVSSLELPCTICCSSLPRRTGSFPQSSLGTISQYQTIGLRCQGQPFSFLPPIFQTEKDKMDTAHHQPPCQMLTGPDAMSSLCRTSSIFPWEHLRMRTCADWSTGWK